MRERLHSFVALIVVVAGGLLGVQARVNGELGTKLHSALDAALVSFAIGTCICAVAVVAVGRAGLRRLQGAELRWWWWFGGFAGAAVVGSTAAGAPKIGVALVSVCIVAGTAVGALIVDAIGLGPGGRLHVTVARLGGALLAVAAVLLGAVGAQHSSVRQALFALLFGAGAASAWQQAANGQLRRASASAAVASLISFAGGTAVLVVTSLAAGSLGDRQWPQAWWLYTGGLLGAVYIGVAAALVVRIGVLRLLLATVAGQLTAGVILDLAWPEPGAHLRTTTVIGSLLTLVAVAVTGLRRRTPTVKP